MGVYESANGTSKRLSNPKDTNSTQVIRLEAPPIIDRNWVQQQTDDGLARIFSLVSKELEQRNGTLTELIAVPDEVAEFGEVPDILFEDYLTVPVNPGAALISKARTWHIVLVSSHVGHQPFALKIVGDVVLGRRTTGVDPEIDLDIFDAAVYGVSRTHAVIRPMGDQLLLNDLGSTNGTLLNGEKLELSRSANITDQSVITLGKLHLKVHITRRPEHIVR